MLNPTFPAAAIPYLIVGGAADALNFYKQAFAAEEIARFPMPDGRIGHAEIRIEGAPVFLADDSPEAGAQSPPHLGGTSVIVSIYVTDVDRFAGRAEAAGTQVTRPLADQFYGERTVNLRDPFGHAWHVATVKERLTLDEMMARMPK